MIRAQTSDIDEAISAVAQVYCPHELRLDRRARSVATRLRAYAEPDIAQVRLEYGASVQVDAGSLEGMTLIMHAARGSGSVRQPGSRAHWSGGHTVAVSGNRSTQFDFDPMFAQNSLRLDPAEINTHCARLIGVPLDGDVRFDLAPFSAELEAAWAQILALATRHEILSASGLGYLKQLALDLLLREHPHNYSALLTARPHPVPRLTRDAVDLIDAIPDHELVTASEIAARLGVSLRSLERAFAETLGESPVRYLRGRRLDRVRQQLQFAPAETSVTDVAIAYGFYHPGRFAGYYRERFGESPSATLRRVTARPPRSSATG